MQLYSFYFSSFKPDTVTNANFDAASSKRANFDEVHFFKHTSKIIIFGTHNTQTFKHNTLTTANSVFYLIFILNCITGSNNNYASHCLSTEEACTRYFQYAV